MSTIACMTPISDENDVTGTTFPTSPAPRLDACISDPQCTYPLVVSHRGEGSNHPENAISAIKSVADIAHLASILDTESKFGIGVLTEDFIFKSARFYDNAIN